MIVTKGNLRIFKTIVLKFVEYSKEIWTDRVALKAVYQQCHVGKRKLRFHNNKP